MTSQNKLVIQGKSIAVHYSNRRQKFENWLCNAVSVIPNYTAIPTYFIMN